MAAQRVSPDVLISPPPSSSGIVLPGAPDLTGQRWPAVSSVRGARPARQHCCQGKRAEGASQPHQRPPLRMQVSGRSCNGEEGHPSPAQTGPAGPTAALLSPGTALGGQERTHQFLGSSSPKNQKDERGWA